ncbi:RadC family protein [Pseudothermotoga thermarum]|nr:DNA repair protein RadC [Pseudothermotoga thermarum]
MIKAGSEALSEEELLAIILRTGSQDLNVMDLAKELWETFGKSLRTLFNASLQEIASIKGIGIAKATSIKASLELGKRLYEELSENKLVFTNPESIYQFCHDMRFYEKEVLRVICLDSKLKMVFHRDLTEGTNNQTLFHPREVFRIAIRSNCNFIVLVHNHPSGDPTPSFEDRISTDKIVAAGEIIGIPVLDHVVVGSESFFSFRENGLLDSFGKSTGKINKEKRERKLRKS